jgi:hypothetical protein
MSYKQCFRFLLATSLAGLSALLLVSAVPVKAQCEQPPLSSCSTCHAQEDPVNENGEWHVIHASKDICTNCHGGNGSSLDKDLAHEGITLQPLSDIYTDCHSCHPDYDERAAQFAPTLQVTPGSCPTSTPAPVASIYNQPPADPFDLSPDTAAENISILRYLVVLGPALAVLAFFLMGIGWLERHHA